MKKLFSLIFLFTILNAGDVITSFQGYYQTGKIILEWNTQDESNIDYFLIQRSMNNGLNYYDISEISSQGSASSYVFIDHEIIGSKSDLSYTYRVLIYYSDGKIDAETSPVTVSLTVSSVQMTWGSIKAMFR